MTTDPYAAPKSRVADVSTALAGHFLPEGRSVPGGRGWSWIAEGWGLFMRQPGVWILMIVVLFLIFLVLALIPFIGNVATPLLGPVFTGGIMLGCRALERGEDLQIAHLFAGFREHAGTLVLIGLFYMLATFAAVFIAALIGGVGFGALIGFGDPSTASGARGAMAFIIAALVMLALMVPAAMAIWFAPALVVLNDATASESLLSSFFACLKNIVPYLVYAVILFVLAIAASIPFGLGWFALGPTLAASMYTAYRDIYYD